MEGMCNGLITDVGNVLRQNSAKWTQLEKDMEEMTETYERQLSYITGDPK